MEDPSLNDFVMDGVVPVLRGDSFILQFDAKGRTKYTKLQDLSQGDKENRRRQQNRLASKRSRKKKILQTKYLKAKLHAMYARQETLIKRLEIEQGINANTVLTNGVVPKVNVSSFTTTGMDDQAKRLFQTIRELKNMLSRGESDGVMKAQRSPSPPKSESSSSSSSCESWTNEHEIPLQLPTLPLPLPPIEPSMNVVQDKLNAPGPMSMPPTTVCETMANSWSDGSFAQQFPLGVVDTMTGLPWQTPGQAPVPPQMVPSHQLPAFSAPMPCCPVPSPAYPAWTDWRTPTSMPTAQPQFHVPHMPMMPCSPAYPSVVPTPKVPKDPFDHMDGTKEDRLSQMHNVYFHWPAV